MARSLTFDVFFFLLISFCLLVSMADASGRRPPVKTDVRNKMKVLGDNETITVHVVPHTHDDVGWLKTVDEYYSGLNKSIQPTAVKFILDTVVSELQLNPNRTFIYVEMAFFTRWWNEQNNKTKDIVRQLVKNKQLEFVNAGWCMNDEAAAHYNAIIDQMTLGLQFVADTFGDDARPRVAWQIDPFGHSSEMANMFASMGYDGLFFARNDYDDRNKRLKDNTMEMVWRPSRSLGNMSELFTGVLFYHYGPPPGMCFDIRCADPPIQDDPSLFDYNVDERVTVFIRDILLQAGNYRHNHVMFTFGSDFQYESAREYYTNIDKLMKYTMEKEPRIKVMYSTPSRYLDAVYQTNLSWTVKEDDFFPYADDPYSYWTGYFTSRPALKGYTREMNSFLQVCKHLEMFGVPLKPYRKLNNVTSMRLQEAMGVEQHHDAVSGTEKQHVANDYAKRLHIGQVECEALIGDVAGAYLSVKPSTPPPTLQWCESLNVSVCPASETGNFNVLIYNPIGRSRPFVKTFPVNGLKYTVTDNEGKTIASQLVDVSEATKHARGSLGTAKNGLTIMDNLPALGFKTYFIREASSYNSSAVKGVKVTTQTRIKNIHQNVLVDPVIENDAVQVSFDATSKRLKTITNKMSHISLNVDQGFYWYNASIGKNINSTQTSGAYIFRPNSSFAFDVSKNGDAMDLNITQGDIYMEASQSFGSWLYQSVRIYEGVPIVEFEYTVGPIPIDDHHGKEIITRYTTQLETEKTWYTDANGREIQTRIRNYRPTWTLNNTEPISENYYPVNSRIYMRDTAKDIQFTVMTDRSQGGSSIVDGQLELMLHRRLLVDDRRGVGEALNEPGVDGKGLIIRGRHVVIIDNVANSTFLHRMIGEMLMLREQPLFVVDSAPPANFLNNYTGNYTALTKDLPPNVHLLTLQSMGNGFYLIRLEHQFEMDETPLNASVTLSLADMFVFQITSVTELALSANVKAPVSRLKWTSDTPANPRPSSYGTPVPGPNFPVTLYPMEIRTFQIEVTF